MEVLDKKRIRKAILYHFKASFSDHQLADDNISLALVLIEGRTFKTIDALSIFCCSSHFRAGSLWLEDCKKYDAVVCICMCILMFSLRPWQTRFDIKNLCFPSLYITSSCMHDLGFADQNFFWLAVSNPGPKHYSGFPHCHHLPSGISDGRADRRGFHGHLQGAGRQALPVRDLGSHFP